MTASSTSAPLIFAAAAACALSACGGTDAAILPIENPGKLTVRRMEITLRNMASSRTETVKVPETESADPIPFPTHVTFTYPLAVRGYFEVSVDGFDGAKKTAHGEGAVKVVQRGLTEFPPVVLAAP